MKTGWKTLGGPIVHWWQQQAARSSLTSETPFNLVEVKPADDRKEDGQVLRVAELSATPDPLLKIQSPIFHHMQKEAGTVPFPQLSWSSKEHKREMTVQE